VVIGEQPPEALKVILGRCLSLDIIPEAANKRFIREMDMTGRPLVHEFDVAIPREVGVIPGLKGQHQIENAYTAIMVAGTLTNDFGLEISEDQIKLAVENASHPGRLEFIDRYLLDGAHNIGGARALRAYLDEFADKPITMIFGAMRDKDVNEIAEILFPAARTLILTRPNNERAIEPEVLVPIASRYAAGADIIKTSTVAEALIRANAPSKECGLILITGSLYLVGEAKAVLQ